MTNTNETVEVPVALLKNIVEPPSGNRQFQQDISKLRALLPKPKPRLVAVTTEQFEYESTEWFDAQPDVLTTIDEVLDDAEPGTPHSLLKIRIGTALGVTE